MENTRTARHIGSAIHDTIEDGANAVEEIHRAVAGLSLDLLGSFKPLEAPVNELRDVQSRAITSAYGVFRRTNDRIGKIVDELLVS